MLPTKDDLDPEDPLPLFLAGEPELHVFGKLQDRAVAPSRILKGSILVAATAIGMGVLAEGNPMRLIADVTASMADKSALQPVADQSSPTIQSTAVAENLLLAAKDEPTRDEIAAAFKSAPQRQIESEHGEYEALFRKFQAWAAEKDAQAQAGLAQSVQDAPAAVVQDGPAQVEKNARAPLRHMKKNLQKVRSARAEIRRVRHLPRNVRREQNAGPTQTAQAQDQAVQKVETPSFLQMFGWHN